MYKKLTDNQIKNLMRNREDALVVSHVGDGEYSCNVFGNIYSSFWQAFKHAKLALPNSYLGVYSWINDENLEEIYICWGDKESYDSYNYMPKIARLTLERVNQKFDTGL